MTKEQQDRLRRYIIAADFIAKHLMTLKLDTKEAALNLEQLVAVIAEAKQLHIELCLAAKDNA